MRRFKTGNFACLLVFLFSFCCGQAFCGARFPYSDNAKRLEAGKKQAEVTKTKADSVEQKERLTQRKDKATAVMKSFRWTENNLRTHWQKHQAEFPEYKNQQQYGQAAVLFFQKPPQTVLTKFRGDGDRLQYDEKSNTFAVATKDGVIKTMFRPDRGIRYWNRQ